MFTSEGAIDEATRKELTHRIAKISPVMAKKAVWFDHALIVRTDNVEAPVMRETLEVRVGDITLKSALTSGSIGKLKKAVPR